MSRTLIHYGRSGEFATNRRDEQELGAVATHILQAALVYVNTLMIQEVLAEPAWQGVLTEEDLRGLTPLFWTPRVTLRSLPASDGPAPGPRRLFPGPTR